MTTEKLTMHALKQHDHIHPNFKPSTAAMPNNKELPRQSSRPEMDPNSPTRRRSRKTSTSETHSSKSYPSTKPKMSIFRFVTATHAWHRLASKNSKSRGTRPPKLENTYKLEPDDRKKFMPGKVEKILEEVLESRLHEVRYNPLTCREMSTDIASYIKTRVKAMDFPRYKIVSNLIIMENKGQGAEVVSRCVWDPNSDSFATYTYRNACLVATAYVHGIYFE